jgi:biotin-(acetyl-CoA carboxylase) ligase
MNLKLNDIFNKIVFHLEETYLHLKSNDSNYLKEKYLANLYWLDEEHSFESSIEFRGTITDIDEYGRLKVRTMGEIKIFNFNEITYLE